MTSIYEYVIIDFSVQHIIKINTAGLFIKPALDIFVLNTATTVLSFCNIYI